MYLLYTPIEYIDEKKKLRAGGPICIKTPEGGAYIAFENEELAEYYKKIYNIDANIITLSELNTEYPELSKNINKVLLFNSVYIFEEFQNNKKDFNYSAYIKDIKRID